jgi:hypothetical protein
VFAGSPSEPDPLHSHIVSDINILCKAQHHFASVPITRITTELGRPEVSVGDVRITPPHPSELSGLRSRSAACFVGVNRSRRRERSSWSVHRNLAGPF